MFIFNNGTFLCAALSMNSTTSIFNYSFNSTSLINNTNDELSFCQQHWVRCIAISSLLSILILCTIIGNAFVIAAVVLDRNLNNVANHLIVSLAVADLMVATMVSFFFKF